MDAGVGDASAGGTASEVAVHTGRSGGSNDLSSRAASHDTGKQSSFMNKVVSWFSKNQANTGNRHTPAESFSNLKQGNESASTDVAPSQASVDAQSNSFGPALGGRVQATNQFSAQYQYTGNQYGQYGQQYGQQYGKGRDPVMEEVQNSTFSLKIMVSCGSVCVFHVGGNIDEVTDPTMPEVG